MNSSSSSSTLPLSSLLSPHFLYIQQYNTLNTTYLEQKYRFEQPRTTIGRGKFNGIPTVRRQLSTTEDILGIIFCPHTFRERKEEEEEKNDLMRILKHWEQGIDSMITSFLRATQGIKGMY
ncbi:uncharacterized protein [Spinacia oleracea]|uniref:Uncharacterized protein n=1 Tax=Spinacia oleracea TaxID=3562 RepID=A0ABM3QVZ5_SPIOL|nr:uncharacterized protein LOC110787563 [Spinacia oleracea]